MNEIATVMQYLTLSMMIILEMTLLVIQAMTLRDQTRIQHKKNEQINKGDHHD